MSDILNHDFKVHAGTCTVYVQRHAWKLGYEWSMQTQTLQESALFICFYKEDKILELVNSYHDFSKKEMPELTIADFFELKPIEKRFARGDTVIVRNHGGDIWRAAIYSHYIKGAMYPFFTIGDIGCQYCLPETEENLKLVGTTDSHKVN